MSRTTGRFVSDDFEQEVPAGLVNGTNKVFTISAKPEVSKAVLVTLNGLMTDAYTISGQTITMTDAPVLGQKILVYYMKG